MRVSLITAVVLGVLLSASFFGKDEKLKPEEVIAKHLESIGPAAKRKTVQSRSTVGTAQVTFRVGGSGTLNGKGRILSQANSIRTEFSFPAIDYSGELIAFDGMKVTAGQISPGNYPPFSRFLYENNLLVKEGMLFGSLSTAWVLLDFPERKPKLDLNGPKKIDGRQLYELKYTKNNQGNLFAWFYFDAETFRHVRSQFKLETPTTQLTRISDSAELVRYQILEQFDDFKVVDGLTLPHSYKVDFTIDAPRGGMLASWTHNIESITHNENIDRRLFSVQ
jgi:hypothetical protein